MVGCGGDARACLTPERRLEAQWADPHTWNFNLIFLFYAIVCVVIMGALFCLVKKCAKFWGMFDCCTSRKYKEWERQHHHDGENRVAAREAMAARVKGTKRITCRNLRTGETRIMKVTPPKYLPQMFVYQVWEWDRCAQCAKETGWDAGDVKLEFNEEEAPVTQEGVDYWSSKYGGQAPAPAGSNAGGGMPL